MLTQESSSTATSVVQRLEADGIVLLPGFLEGQHLAAMQAAFRQALGRLRINVASGFEKSELYRDMVEDVLMLDQGFVDAALHPTVTQTLREYIGPGYQLVEAKGWLSYPTRRDFHGWHGDEWYDKTRVTDHIPREVKLAFYLTDVESGYFEYVRGTHQREAPRYYRNTEVGSTVTGEIVQARGPAGTAILFDTSGVHRQSVPILLPRHAAFYNYHDSSIPLQPSDLKGNRYHPLLLNAAFLGGLSDEDRRVLGFGDQTNHRPGYVRPSQSPLLDKGYRACLQATLKLGDLGTRIGGRVKRLLKG